MHFFRILFAFSWVQTFRFVVADVAPLNSGLHIRDASGASSSDTLYALRRSLSSVANKRDTVFKNSTSINTSWNGVTLFSIEGKKSEINASVSGGVAIVCTTCYIKGTATAQFTVNGNGNFNVSQAFDNATSAIETEVSNITTSARNYIKTTLENTTSSILTNGFSIDDFDFPPLEVDFDVKVPEIPACDLSFQFDGLELYMEIDTTLSAGATYSLNLYTSKSPIGFDVASDVLLGVVFSVDLIFSADSEVDISTGFHIQLHDGMAINIPMFDQDVSNITFNGGNFEFLPVTIQTSGVVLTALLRVGITAGVDFSTPPPAVTIADLSLQFSAGIVAAVFADVAQFVTNITDAPSSSGDKCDLPVVQEYTMLLGANAGATLAVGAHTWGPSPNTQVPLFFTTLDAACAVTGTVSAAATGATITARNAASSTTTSTEITYTNTAILCLSTGLLNCPASLQSTSHNTVTKTLVSVVPSGSKATFVTAASNTAVTTIPFGTNVKAITSTSGSPVSFVPTSSPTGGTGITGVLNGKTNGVSNKLVIGVSVGVGVPVLIAIIAGLVLFCRRKRARKMVSIHASPISEPYTPASYNFSKKLPVVTVSESRRRGY